METRGRRGFTLVELLIVMVMIAILAAIAIPRFIRVRERALTGTMIADLRNLASQQELYIASNATYGSDLSSVGISASRDVQIDITEATPTGWAATAVHGGLTGAQCGIYFGTAAASNGAPAEAPGVITCDAVP